MTKPADNEVISKWRGECRHEGHHYENGRYGGFSKCHTCGREDDDQYRFMDDVINYDSDPSAWTPELYQKIEDAGLWKQFALNIVCEHIPNFNEIKLYGKIINTAWEGIKATPEQKASALARAIEEVE